MNEQRNDPGRGARGLAGETSGGGPHCGSKRLIAYHQGGLSAAERARVQEHLSLCPRCTGLLRELREFEAAAAGADAGPEDLRGQAWKGLVRRLPANAPVVRPIAGVPRRERRPWWRPPRAVAAALALALLGLTLWAVLSGLAARQRLEQLEQRLQQREAALAAARVSLATTEGQLAAARGRLRVLEQDEERDRRSGRPASREEDLAAQVAALTAEIQALRRSARAPQPRDQIAASEIQVAISPRFVLRGEAAPGGGLLRAGGAVNPVRTTAPEGRFTVLLSLPAQAVYDEYRLELANGDGEVLWSGRRPARSVLGDAGTAVTISRLPPGLYRLRIAGSRPQGSAPLAEYLLAVEASTPQP